MKNRSAGTEQNCDILSGLEENWSGYSAELLNLVLCVGSRRFTEMNRSDRFLSGFQLGLTSRQSTVGIPLLSGKDCLSFFFRGDLSRIKRADFWAYNAVVRRFHTWEVLLHYEIKKLQHMCINSCVRGIAFVGPKYLVLSITNTLA